MLADLQEATARVRMLIVRCNRSPSPLGLHPDLETGARILSPKIIHGSLILHQSLILPAVVMLEDGRTMAGPWPDHGRTMARPWPDHGRIMAWPCADMGEDQPGSLLFLILVAPPSQKQSGKCKMSEDQARALAKRRPDLSFL